MKYFVNIDNGGTGIKAALSDEFGKFVSVHSERTPLETPRSDFNERDMTLLWDTTALCIRRMLEKTTVAKSDIVAVCCTGHGKGLYLWGKDDAPAYKGIASTDQRGLSIMKRWVDDGTMKKAMEISKQGLYACQPVVLLRWLKENSPEVLENVKWIFEAKDYIRFCLTGEAFAEVTDYSGTNMMNLSTASFDKELFSLFGIEEMFDRLPPLRYSTDVCGHITKKAAEATGLPEGIPVAGGMFDIDACALAMGGDKSDTVYVITGTWSINEYVSNTTKNADGVVNSLFCLPGKYLIESSSPTSAGNLDWFLTHFTPQIVDSSGNTDYETANSLVASLKATDSDVVFLPFLYGTNTNVPKACFYGLDNAHDVSHLLRAIYEGVVFCHMDHLSKLIASREKPAYIALSGGVCKSKVWTKMFADTIGIPVKIIDTEELGCLGCAIVASVASGTYETMDKAIEVMVNVKDIVEPDPEEHKTLQAKYSRYRKLINALESL